MHVVCVYSQQIENIHIYRYGMKHLLLHNGLRLLHTTELLHIPVTCGRDDQKCASWLEINFRIILVDLVNNIIAVTNASSDDFEIFESIR